jgi:hypothetical protein
LSRVEVAAAATGDGWACAVTVSNGAETHHRVLVTRGDLARLAPSATDPTDLVRASFVFLLEHEPKESILSEFHLTLIGRYFPDYEREIGHRLPD